ncbi:Osiris 14 [Carabus blaptoides fortunei]
MEVYSSVVVLVVLGSAFCFANNTDEISASAPQQCSEVKGLDNTITCMAMNTLNRLQTITSRDNIKILPGVELTSEISANEREAGQHRSLELPASIEDKFSKIFDMMLGVMNNLFTGRTLKVKIPENTSNALMRSFVEGRGKMKKFMGPLMMALGAKMIAVVPIMLGGLAIFAAKALLISKLAITVALVVGIQYLFSNGGGNFFGKLGQNAWGNFGGGSFGGHGGFGYAPAWNNGGWNGGASQSYPYARSMDDNPLEKVYETCVDDVKCAEEKVINLIDDYDTKPSVEMLDGVLTINKVGEELPVVNNEGALDRAVRYLSNHELKFKLPLNSRNGRSLLSETRSSKLKKIILPILLLLKLKAAIVIPIVLSVIALVAFKGLGAGLIALALSGATAFKSSLEGHSSKKVSFEVVPPHWSRAGLAPSGPAGVIPASFLQEWPIHGYQTMPQ